MHRYSLAVVGGLAIWAAFPTFGVWPLAPIGVGLLAVATCGAGGRRGFLLGLLAGLAYLLPLLSWSGTYVGDLPWVALATLEALYVALAGLACGVLQRPRPGELLPRVRPLAVACVWVSAEALRDRTPFGGFPWGRLAFSQADSQLVRLAAWAGAPGVTFAVALLGALLAAAVVRLAPQLVQPAARRSVQSRVARTSALRHAVAALAGAAAVGGVAPSLVALPTDGRPAQLLAVQGNVPRAGLDFNAQRRAVLDNHVAATEAAARAVDAGYRPRPDLVLWPENSSDIDPLRNADAALRINRAVHAVGVPILLGAVLDEPAPWVSNASLLWTPTAGVTQRYVKRHPVPFAEYIPYRSFFRVLSSQVDLVQRDFAAGQGAGVFRVAQRSAPGRTLAAGAVICFEVAYDDLVRDTVARGANLLVVQTNNATFGYTDESAQQLAISRLRAIEHGRSLVHISTVGVSALVTPDGVAHQESSLFTTALLSASLPLRTATTVADVLGPWPEYVACLLTALLLVGVPRRIGSAARRRAHPSALKGGPRRLGRRSA